MVLIEKIVVTIALITMSITIMALRTIIRILKLISIT